MNWKLISEIIGIIAIVENIFIFAMLKQEKILGLKFISDLLWFLNMLCLGAYTGAILNVISMGRETVFYYRDKKRVASHFFWLPLFLCLTLLSPTLECVGAGRFIWVTLLPTIGSMVMVYALYQKNSKVTKHVALFSQTLWLIYCIYTKNITASVANGLQIISAGIGLMRERSAIKR